MNWVVPGSLTQSAGYNLKGVTGDGIGMKRLLAERMWLGVVLWLVFLQLLLVFLWLLVVFLWLLLVFLLLLILLLKLLLPLQLLLYPLPDVGIQEMLETRFNLVDMKRLDCRDWGRRSPPPPPATL